jgi:uncharacterized protein
LPPSSPSASAPRPPPEGSPAPEQVQHLSAAAARRIALAAQGFARPRPQGRIDARHIRGVLDHIGLLQLDSVNVLSRSHYLPLFSRLGPYPHELIDSMAAHSGAGLSSHRWPSPARRELFEYWGHEASLLPVECHRLLRWRMARADKEAWGGMRRLSAEKPELISEVLEMVRERGPIRAGETGHSRAKGPAEMWSWHDGKTALEYLFYEGRVAAAGRSNFERLYDLPERVLPASVLSAPTPSEEDAQRELVQISARCLGVATEPDLGDYFRLPRAASKARVAELVQSGELLAVTVEGWDAPAYLWPAARRPRRVQARALLSPFDSLVWCRPRAERLFSFSYRLEIYTPAAKRVHGYYVLPFLLGEELVARVDLKADRKASTLRVLGAFCEPDRDEAEVASELAAELESMRDWLGLEQVSVRPHGDLGRALKAAV